MAKINNSLINQFKTSPAAQYVLLAVVCCFLLLPLLGYGAVFQVSEAREGVVVNEILGSGNIVLPRRHGETMPSKPILFHWVGSAFAVVLGQYQEFELRLPSALAAIACVLMVFGFVRSTTNILTALSAAAILMSTNGFVNLASDGRVDMLFCALTTAACLLWFYAAVECYQHNLSLSEIPGRTYVFVGLLSGLAILTKGPLGLVYPLLIVSAISWYFWGLAGLRCLIRPGWVFALLVALPWYVLATVSGRDSFVARQIVFENISRFFGGSGITSKPPWFYLEHFWLQAIPWSLIIAAYLIALAVGYVRNGKKLPAILVPTEKKTRFLFLSTAIWIIVTVVFLSMSSGKRRAYLLSILPVLSIFLSLLGNQLALVFTEKFGESGPEFLYRRATRMFAAGLWLVVLLVPVLTVFVAKAPWVKTAFSCGQCGVTLAAIEGLISQLPLVFVVYFVVFALGSVFFWRRGQARRNPIFLAVSVFLFLQWPLSYKHFALAVKGSTHSYRDFAAEIGQVVPSDRELYSIKVKADESFDGLFFYLQRRVLLLPPTSLPKKNAHYLARRSWFLEQPEAFQQNVKELLSGGRAVDSTAEQLLLFEVN